MILSEAFTNKKDMQWFLKHNKIKPKIIVVIWEEHNKNIKKEKKNVL